jgi:hypothetical protein
MPIRGATWAAASRPPGIDEREVTALTVPPDALHRHPGPASRVGFGIPAPADALVAAGTVLAPEPLTA